MASATDPGHVTILVHNTKKAIVTVTYLTSAPGPSAEMTLPEWNVR